MALMRMDTLEVSPERAVVRMPVEGHLQTFGRLHGGASAALAETAASIAAADHARRAHPGTNAVAVGVDLNITHHRAAREGTVTATARAVHTGLRTATYEIELVDEGGRRVATARLTTMIIVPAPEESPA